MGILVFELSHLLLGQCINFHVFKFNHHTITIYPPFLMFQKTAKPTKPTKTPAKRTELLKTICPKHIHITLKLCPKNMHNTVNTFKPNDTYIYTAFVSTFLQFSSVNARHFFLFTHHAPTISHVLVFPRCGCLLEPARLDASLCSCCVPCCFPRVVSPPWCSFCSASGSCTLGVAPFPRVAPASRSSPQPWPASALTWHACWLFFCSSFPSVLILYRLCTASI